jgi:hypothetical protein
MDIEREEKLVALVRFAATMLEAVGRGYNHEHAAGQARQFRAILREMGYIDPRVTEGFQDDDPPPRE